VNRPIRIAFFGNGFTRRVILPCLRHVEGIELVGLSSPNLERAEATAREFGIRQVASHHEQILKRTAPDLVFVVTPPHRHKEMTIDALRAGCHVICEKPMGMNAEECAQMSSVARAIPERIALINHELRFHPHRTALKRWIAEGRFGMIRHASYILLSSSRRDPSRAWDWWSDSGQGGGTLGAVGSHAIDALRVLFGEVAAVRGNLRTLVEERIDPTSGRPRPVTSDDSCGAWIRFRSGIAASVLISSVESERLHRISVAGTTGGAAVAEQGSARIALGGEAMREVPIDWEVPTCAQLGIPETDWARTFLIFARRIVEALRNGETHLAGAATFEDGYRTQCVMDAIRESSRTETWIAVDEGGQPMRTEP
jgi:predicted dehydrogenase